MAAEQKKDESILLHIRDKDCVAIEACYHKKCYASYTNFLHYEPVEDKEERLYEKSYQHFCKQGVAYIPIVSFHEPGKRNMSELVFSEDLSKGVIAAENISMCDSSDTESGSQEEIKTETPSTSTQKSGSNEEEEMRTLFHAAMILHVVEECRSVCLVVPLIALMNDQVASLTSRGLSAACVGGESECSPDQIREICEGKYKIVFGTPEALLNNHRGIFRSPLKKHLKAVFIDESHCIAK
ncbi:ATP-dependent DNA helicase, partial [Paramuricea clavata]